MARIRSSFRKKKTNAPTGMKTILVRNSLDRDTSISTLTAENGKPELQLCNNSLNRDTSISTLHIVPENKARMTVTIPLIGTLPFLQPKLA